MPCARFLQRHCRVALACGVLLLCGTCVFAAPTDGTWIWDQAGANQNSQDDAVRYFRRVFELPAKPVKAVLAATADNSYVAYINGTRVGGDGEWASLDQFDVTKLLVEGKNVLALEATNAGGVAGAYARLDVTLPDKKSVGVGTDAKTRASLVALEGWAKPEFDDSKWAFAFVLGDSRIGPWSIAGGPAASQTNNDPAQTNILDSKITERLSAEDELKHLVVPEGFEIELVAAEPLVINPVTITLDEQGRIYVSESHTYRYGPDGSPVKPFKNPIVRLEPKAGGGYERVLIADGFDDPVMGMAIRDGKLWAAANNFLYQFDLPASGPAANRKLLVEDKNKAWNPFGMFVLEWGPDGMLYMSVGDHGLKLEGPTNKLSARGSSGVIMRMKPDGSEMEGLTQGQRVPYSFEYDPFGQLWLLSNGEGNPNRFFRIIENVDYHCFTRGVDYKWLAGQNPLSPPCFELPGGAHTQLLRYYGAAYPESYQGSLFLDNWGRHGFGGSNRAIFRYVPDEHNDIATKEAFVSCADPHFRVAHIALDPDGNMLLADWYGRDDESDLTGRIWRVRYTGNEKRPAWKPLDAAKSSSVGDLIAELAAPSQRAREEATVTLVRLGNAIVPKLAENAAKAIDPLGAAYSLWALVRIGSPEAKVAIAAGAKNPDWRVRRLAINLLRRFEVPGAAATAASLANDPDMAVRIAAAEALASPAEIRAAMLAALESGAAEDSHWRYEAAWHLAKNADARSLEKLLSSESEKLQLAGQIAIDIACYEKFETMPIALDALRKQLETAKPADIEPLLALARFHADASFVPVFVKLAARTDLPVSTTGQVLLVIKSKTAVPEEVIAASGKRLLEAVASGQVAIETQSDWLLLFDLLAIEGPTDFAVQQLGRSLHHQDMQLRDRAHQLIRSFGPKAAALGNPLWGIVFNQGVRFEDKPEMLITLSRIESPPNAANWERLLMDPNPLVRREGVRWWRLFKDQPEAIAKLRQLAPKLIEQDSTLKDELAIVLPQLGVQASDLVGLGLPQPNADKAALTEATLATVEKSNGDEKRIAAVAGRAVFERVGCVKCHTTIDANTPKAPSLKGIGQAQKPPYLVESVLFPSKILKTGFETENIQTTDGRVFVGLVKEEGDFLRVLNADQEVRLAKKEVEERAVQKLSIMPENQEQLISPREFADLVEYLGSLK